MNNALAWFELGVKQQENEREKKALQALERAVQLDADHLPTWLALAVSYTNDGNRMGTYEAIHQWVTRNERYQSIVGSYREEQAVAASHSERFTRLLDCLVSMARNAPAAEVDADIQIALAVLFNTSEVCQAGVRLELGRGGSYPCHRTIKKLKIVSALRWQFVLMYVLP
jgi:peroxin-5